MSNYSVINTLQLYENITAKDFLGKCTATNQNEQTHQHNFYELKIVHNKIQIATKVNSYHASYRQNSL